MMLFNQTETEAAKSALLKADAADQKRLKALQSEFRSLQPEWERWQERCEFLAALADASGSTYRRGMSEVFWGERGPKLQAELELAMQQRDGLTATLPAEIEAVRKRIHDRRQRVVGAFQSWAGQIMGQLPAPLAGELAKARGDLPKVEDLATIITAVEDWVSRIARFDETPVSLGVLNVARLLREAAEVK